MQKRKNGTPKGSPSTPRKSSNGNTQNEHQTIPKELNMNVVGFLVAIHVVSLYTILVQPLHQQTLQLLVVFYTLTMFSLSAGK